MSDNGLKFLEGLGIDPEAFGITDSAIYWSGILNLVTGLIMLVIGAILLYRTRKLKNCNKKTAGWILIGLGTLITLSRVVQMVFM